MQDTTTTREDAAEPPSDVRTTDPAAAPLDGAPDTSADANINHAALDRHGNICDRLVQPMGTSPKAL